MTKIFGLGDDEGTFTELELQKYLWYRLGGFFPAKDFLKELDITTMEELQELCDNGDILYVLTSPLGDASTHIYPGFQVFRKTHLIIPELKECLSILRSRPGATSLAIAYWLTSYWPHSPKEDKIIKVLALGSDEEKNQVLTLAALANFEDFMPWIKL